MIARLPRRPMTTRFERGINISALFSRNVLEAGEKWRKKKTCKSTKAVNGIIEGLKWKQQDAAAFVLECCEHMEHSCKTSQGSQIWQKCWIIFFTQAVEVRGDGAEGVGFVSLFWTPLEITVCLLVASPWRLITVKSNLLLIIHLWKLSFENKRSTFTPKSERNTMISDYELVISENLNSSSLPLLPLLLVEILPCCDVTRGADLSLASSCLVFKWRRVRVLTPHQFNRGCKQKAG